MRTIIFALAASVLAGQAFPSPIIYSLQATEVSGYFAHALEAGPDPYLEFSGATVTVTALGDTANFANGAVYSPLTSENVPISGLGTFALPSPTEFFAVEDTVNAADNVVQNTIIAIFSDSLTGYDLSYIGPIVSTSGFVGSAGSSKTSAGLLYLAYSSGTYTFSASAVPEPTAWTFVLFGLGLIVFARRTLLRDMADRLQHKTRVRGLPRKLRRENYFG